MLKTNTVLWNFLLIKNASNMYHCFPKNIVETSTLSKKLWDTIKAMTNMNTRHKHLFTRNDLEKAN